MRGKQLSFFATTSDLFAVLANGFRASHQYVPMAVSDPSGIATVVEASDLKPHSSYLIQRKGRRTSARRIDQDDGTTRYVVDPIENPGSAVLRTGGPIKDRLLPGDISTKLEDEESLKIFAELASSFRMNFEKVKSFRVGPEATDLLDQGGRLSPTEKSPPEYDLAR